MENLGNISISQYSVSYGGKRLFSHPTNISKTVGIRISTTKTSNQFDRLSVFQDKILYDIELSNEQWSSLLLNFNSKNGVPCTINARSDSGKLIKTEKPFENKEFVSDSPWEQNKLAFEKEIKEMLPLFFSSLKRIKEIIYSEKMSAADRKELAEIKDLVINQWYENHETIHTIAEKYLNNIDSVAKEELKSDLTRNFLSFSAGVEKESILSLLSDLKKEHLLIEEKIQEEKVFNSYGTISIESITSTTGYLEDEDAVNGIRMTLSSAKFDYTDGIKVVVPDETLSIVEMSMSQWSDFITNFNAGSGQTMTLTYTKQEGESTPVNLSLDHLNKRVDEFNEFIQTIQDKIHENDLKVSHRIKKNIGKRSQREAEIEFEVLINHPVNNLFFYFNEILEAKMKSNICKRQDIQFSIQKRIQDLGMQKLHQEIAQNGIESLKLIFSNTKLIN